MILGRNIFGSDLLNIASKKISSTNGVKLLAVIIDNKLTFKKHITELKRVTQTSRFTPNNRFSIEKVKLLATAFINSQFLYTPSVWMFASKNLIKKIHFRTPQYVCDKS